MLRDCNFKNSYSSGISDPREFFTEALIESKHFDLGLGFFSSSAFRALSYGFAVFIANGGTMRIVINHILSKKDKDAIQKGESSIVSDFEERMLHDIDELRRTLSKEDEHFYKCFAYLVQKQRLQFVATISSSGGLAHDKYGVLTDDNGYKVAFIGSANFSSSALESNAETITVFRSWQEKDRVCEYETQFANNWEKDTDHLIHIPMDRVITHIAGKFDTSDLKELLKDGADLRELANIGDCKSAYQSKPLPKYLIEKIELKEQEPRFPFPEERRIQIDAYEAWLENDRQGIFAMATGSGKTVTALNCVLKEYKKYGFYKVIIVVPTQALAVQWERECKNFNFQNIISTHTEKDWKNILSRYVTQSFFDQKQNIVLITTYATFNRKDIRFFLRKVKGSDSFIYIADEAHNLGSASCLKTLPNNIKRRIGLSATPERVYDERGSKEMYEFFNSQPPAYTYRFTMKDAIDAHILCEYDYHPIFIKLQNDEMCEYKRITEQLRKYIDPETHKYKPDADKLLLKRKRVIHKARNKKDAIINLLEEQKGKGKLNYTFVFVPEGYEANYSEKDNYEVEAEDIHLIDEYSLLFKERGYKYHQYVSGMNYPESVLKNFASGEIQVLLSMKCLDEGVDIPRAEFAVFCSSTGNPRQFVQRRGRVLRKCKGKEKATIWDLVVLPVDSDDDETSQVEANLFKNEVRRILNFAALARNRISILYGTLADLCDKYSIDEFEMLEEEYEQYK